VHHVVLTPEQLAQLTGALGSGGDLSALSGSLGSSELLQRLISPAAQAEPEAAAHQQQHPVGHTNMAELQHAQQQQHQPDSSSYMEGLPSSGGMDTQAAAQQAAAGAEAAVLQQCDVAGAGAVADGQQQGAVVDAVDAVMLPQDVQQGVKRKAGECQLCFCCDRPMWVGGYAAVLLMARLRRDKHPASDPGLIGHTISTV
jgi:hypothetical protein